MYRQEKLATICFAFIVLMSFISLSTRGQLSQGQIDSLVTELRRAKEDTNKVKILMQLANNAGYIDLNGALKYALQG